MKVSKIFVSFDQLDQDKQLEIIKNRILDHNCFNLDLKLFNNYCFDLDVKFKWNATKLQKLLYIKENPISSDILNEHITYEKKQIIKIMENFDNSKKWQLDLFLYEIDCIIES